MKNNIVIKYGGSILCVLLFIYVYTKNLGTVQVDIEQVKGMQTIQDVQVGMTVEQSFISNQDRLCGIAIQFGTYARENTGRIRFELINESGNKVANTTINKNNLEDNAFYEWYFPPIGNSSNKQYILRIIDESTIKGNEITIYKNEKKIEQEILLTKNNKIEDGGINLITYYIKR